MSSLRSGPRPHTPGTPIKALALLRAACRDPRFRQLDSTAKLLLLYALTEYADGAGCFYVKHETLAQATGLSVSAVRKALSRLRASGLLEAEGWMRPPGARGGPQGANTYRIAATLLDQDDRLLEQASGQKRPPR